MLFHLFPFFKYYNSFVVLDPVYLKCVNCVYDIMGLWYYTLIVRIIGLWYHICKLVIKHAILPLIRLQPQLGVNSFKYPDAFTRDILKCLNFIKDSNMGVQLRASLPFCRYLNPKNWINVCQP